jgi:cell division transport system ATP-binding protein
MISLTGVYKTYQNGPALIKPLGGHVLDNVNLRIQRGEFVYVIGDSGAGKTTLLKLLYGEEVPNRGHVEVLGLDLSRADQSLLGKLRRRVGVIFQDLRLVEELSVFDNVVLSLESAADELRESLKRRALWKRACEEVLGAVGLMSLAKKSAGTLSGGEKSRVAAARALIRQPELLIADEPTGALDRDHTWNLIDLFQKMHLRGTTVILATHDREIVRRARRRSCILKAGKLVVEDGVCIF